GIAGKLIMYASGKMRMKFGPGVYFDVEASPEANYRQSLVGINLKDRQTYTLGDVQSRFVCSPDVDCLLSTME
ncbi:hypothetical protein CAUPRSCDRAFT_4693, partial [Caulochytrium protostelioides]